MVKTLQNNSIFNTQKAGSFARKSKGGNVPFHELPAFCVLDKRKVEIINQYLKYKL